ncbi:hypothetical protein ACTA71_005610 [Dictyostelium dimigraforme]
MSNKPYKEFKINKCIAKDLIIVFPINNEQIKTKKESIKRWKYANKNVNDDNYIEILNEFETIQYSINSEIFQNDFKKENVFKYSMNEYSVVLKLCQRERDFSFLINFKLDIICNGIKDGLGQKITPLFGKLNEDGSPIIKRGSFYNKDISDYLIDLGENKVTNMYHQVINNSFDNEVSIINENWEVIKFPFGSLVLPSFKEICHSVLKELFLINRKETLEKINSLPGDILIGFMDSCFKDKTPVGKEILFELYKNQIINDNVDYLEIETIFPLDKLLNSCIIRDDWFRFNYSNYLVQDLFLPPFQDRFSINVYDNYGLFIHKNVPYDLLDNMLFKHSNNKKSESNAIGQPSIVMKENFINNFHLVTNNMFNDLSKIPKTCFFIGGIITACVTNSINDDAYKDGDVDICFTLEEGNDIVEFIEAYFGPLNELQSEKTTTIHGQHLTISKYYPNRHVQINLHHYPTLEAILVGVDIDASCFAFNGKDLYCLERAMHSINYSINIACELNFNVRGNVCYQKRLFKYLDRGFSIFYLSTPEIDYFLKYIVNNKNGKENDGFSPSIKQNGFALLLSAKLSDQILLELKKPTFSIPYGPSIDKSQTDSFIQYNHDRAIKGYYAFHDTIRFVDTLGENVDNSIQTVLFEQRFHEQESLAGNFQTYSWEQYITNEILRSNRPIKTQVYNN